MFTNQVALKPQKSLIVPSIERIRKWRSEAKNYSSKIEKNKKIEEKEKITAAVLSNSSLEIKSSPVKEKPSMKKLPKSKKDKVETELQESTNPISAEESNGINHENDIIFQVPQAQSTRVESRAAITI